MKSNNYIHHMSYLRNSVAYGYDFWYSCVKWWYLPVFFFHFLIFSFFGTVRRGGGSKGKKYPKMTKKICLFYLISQEPYVIWFSFMVHLCKMMISLRVFFHFFKIFILWVVKGGGGVKGQKLIQNEKKSVCHAPYLRNHHMTLIYGAHV